MKTCFMCGSEDSVIDFKNESFMNCFWKVLFRREKKFAYGEVRLCLDSIDNFGYHSSCYKKVTVLSKKYHDAYAQFCKKHGVVMGNRAPQFKLTKRRKASKESLQQARETKRRRKQQANQRAIQDFSDVSQNYMYVSTPPQVQDEKNNVPLMMIKMEPYTMNNEPDAVSNEATEPKRCRPNTPDSHASMSLQDSITTLNNILSKEKIEDDCDIYGKLLATKLRRYPENERLKMMYKIDGMLISQPPPQPAHSALREHCSQPTINTIELDHSHPSSSTYKPEQTRVYSKTRKVASSTIEITPEAEETILPTALSDIESIEVKSEQMDEHCMTFEAEDEELI